MSLTMNKNWLKGQIELALLAQPVVFPRQAVCGVLLAGGYSPANVTVSYGRPAASVDLSKINVMVNVFETAETQRTGSGIYGQVTGEFSFEVDVLWVADLVGSPPDYSNQYDPTLVFENFVELLQKVLRVSLYVETSAGEFGAQNVRLDNPVTGGTSYLKGRKPEMTVLINQPELAENQVDIFFAASVKVGFMETYSDGPS